MAPDPGSVPVPFIPVRTWWRLGALVVLSPLAFVAVAGAASWRPAPVTAVAAMTPYPEVQPSAQLAVPSTRTVAAYEGHGAWVDVFDFAPAYTGPNPPISPAVVDEMAASGVRTLYLQAARLDDRSPNGLEDPWLLAAFLERAHRAGMTVVGWYLPKWEDLEADLARLRAIADFDVLGQRFDGVAVDIEWIGDLDDATRSARLVTLSEQFRGERGGEALGAIVLPPVLTEVVNTDYWPGFPWAQLAPLYDVWLPMAYWSFRSGDYGDGYRYVAESVARLRANLGRPDAAVHAIGGIGGVDGIDDDPDPEEPLATLDELGNFLRAVTDTAAIGASVYDWRTLEPAARDLVAAGLAPTPGPAG